MSNDYPAKPAGAEVDPIDVRVTRLEAAAALANNQKGSSLKPFLEPSFLLAAAAFIFSLTTTYYSFTREHAQEKDALTTQLRSTLGQFSDTAFKVIDASVRYKTEPQALADATSWANTQNVILTSQAVHLADELGSGAASNDLMAIGNRLRAIGRYKEAELVLGRALPLAVTQIEKIDVDREFAILSYVEKRVSDGTRYYEDAVRQIEDSPGYESNRYLQFQMADIYLNWASSEGSDNCSSAKQHINLASFWADKSFINEQYRFRIQKGQEWLQSHCPS